ncbi:IAP repeat-containing protein 3 [Seminavis robusta]|uniref:IAP repeat-containing protein 3 n=1 Tax=Seminavis robusta TaxID=568900 RepID=A0A9N8HI09_9STRA|nr:IAP repeat-containing protein 3 [Seminavis robusta]|eukprot:Sro746_g196450.1 IAP repeat-containing protein 3 (727) ;mRNA; r:33873-36053
MTEAAGSVMGEDRSHPNLQALDALTLTYPGFERDKREAEAVHLGSSNLSLSFDAAIRRLKVKQRAHDEQKSMRSIHRSHPNLVSLDALKLSYPGWNEDAQRAEEAHNSNPNCDFLEILRKIQVKQLRFENDRSHYRLAEIDNLKLSYPGWKADIRALEKFHFEEAFFLPGDSLFQSKLDGLRRRQQIYIRSTKLRAHRLGQTSSTDQTEEISTYVTPVKKPYAVLLGNKNKPMRRPADPIESDQHETGSDSEDSSVEEERTERQHTPLSPRTPYAVVVDADAASGHLVANATASRTRFDPTNPRPDPPECDKTNAFSNSGSTKNSSGRGGVDCDSTGGYKYTRQRVDCDEQVAVRDQPTRDYYGQEAKSDPLGFSNDKDDDVDDDYYYHQSAPLASCQKQPQTAWPSRLSSYIDLEPIQDVEEPTEEEPIQDDEESTSEDVDRVSALPSSVRYPFSKSYTQRGKSSTYQRNVVNRSQGIYSAPQLPLDEEERSNGSKAFSLATPSSSRAVFPEDTASQSSTRAVWQEERSERSGNRSMVSASSSRAVWAGSPNPYIPQTPLSIRPVVPMPETPPHQFSSRLRGSSSKGSANQHQNSRKATSDHSGIRSMGSEEPRSRDAPIEQSRNRSNVNDQGRVRRARRAAEADRSRGTRNAPRSVSSNATSTSGARSRKLGRCTICGDTDKNHVFVPCGHLCACKNCAGQVIKRNMKCPVCRGSVTEAIQVFL